LPVAGTAGRADRRGRVAVQAGRLGLPAALVTQDVEEATASIGKMAEFEFDTIAFSHFPPLRVNAGEAIKRLTGEASA
jgi:hypothetical protein